MLKHCFFKSIFGVIKRSSCKYPQDYYCFKTQAKISGATMVASDSTMNLGV